MHDKKGRLRPIRFNIVQLGVNARGRKGRLRPKCDMPSRMGVNVRGRKGPLRPIEPNIVQLGVNAHGMLQVCFLRAGMGDIAVLMAKSSGHIRRL